MTLDWASVQPWVVGFLFPGATGAGVAINWWLQARKDKAANKLKSGEDRDSFQLKERELLAAEVANTIQRQREEIDRERAESLRLRKVIDRTCDEREGFKKTAERIHEDWKNSRHQIKSKGAKLWLDWQAGKPAPKEWVDYHQIPDLDTYLKKNDGG